MFVFDLDLDLDLVLGFGADFTKGLRLGAAVLRLGFCFLGAVVFRHRFVRRLYEHSGTVCPVLSMAQLPLADSLHPIIS